MASFWILVKRNMLLFFRDKGEFLTSLIAPMVLLVLYVTFLKGVYSDSILHAIPSSLNIQAEDIEGLVSAQLISSILAVICITISFSANFVLIQDRADKSIEDMEITPVKPSILALSYFVSSALASLCVCLFALGCFAIYLSVTGAGLGLEAVALLALDVILGVLFGTSLSSIIHFFFYSQSAITAISVIISAGYGFLCGAYMPIASFSSPLQNMLSYFPGLYATSLIRNHAMSPALNALLEQGVGKEVVEGLAESFDLKPLFQGEVVSIMSMYWIMAVSIAALVMVYILLQRFRGRSHG